MKKNCLLFAVSACLFACEKQTDPPRFTLTQSGRDVPALLAAFKNDLGALNTAPGATGGRREITWDGVPDALLDTALPRNFFNPTAAGSDPALQRGLVYGEDDFAVSATGFARHNTAAAGEFAPFSGTRVFANLRNNAWPVGFQVAGRSEPAAVEAFGLVVGDVDTEGSVTLEFFEGKESLGRFPVPAKESGSAFSFFGIRFQNRRITEVLVRHQGRLADGKMDLSQGGTDDLVVIDDIVYSEPVAR